MASESAIIPAGYKQTEIGVFPEDWDIKTLGEIGEVTGAGVDKKSNPDEQSVRLVNYVDVYNRRPITSNLLSHWVTAPANKANLCSVRKGDVFFTPTSEVREDIAVSSMALEDIPDAVYSYHLVRLRCNDEVEVAYRAHAFTAKYFLDQASVLADGSGTRYVVNLPNFRRMLVALPPRDEQRRIGTLLTDVETQIAKLSEFIDKKINIKQGAMQELLTGKTRLPGFSGEWDYVELSNLATTGSGGTPDTKNPKYYRGNIPWVSITDMTSSGKTISTTERKLTRSGYDNSATQLFPKDTILYAMYASIGECCIAGMELTTSQAILGIQTNSKLNFEYLYYYLKSIKHEVISLGQQGTQSNLNSEIVRGFKIPLPEIDEQQAIAEVLSDMDAEIVTLEQRLEKTKAIKKGMMQQLLTGRVRLVEPFTPTEVSA